MTPHHAETLANGHTQGHICLQSVGPCQRRCGEISNREED